MGVWSIVPDNFQNLIMKYGTVVRGKVSSFRVGFVGWGQKSCLSYVNDDQAYLITAGFLHKHSYKCKNFAVA